MYVKVDKPDVMSQSTFCSIFEETCAMAFTKKELNIWKFEMEYTYNFCWRLHIIEVFDVSSHSEDSAFHTDTVRNLALIEVCSHQQNFFIVVS